MPRYRSALPQLGGGLFITDGGIETTLIFIDGLDLPDFAAFHLLGQAEGSAALRRYYRGYAELAQRQRTGLILESATWRASTDWGARLGYSASAVAQANRRAIALLAELRDTLDTEAMVAVISGCVGPRGDGYVPGRMMDATRARDYHAAQVEVFARTEADMVTAITMNDVQEAMGITLAARAAAMPVVVSFTVETDGALPTGEPLADAVRRVDDLSAGYPAYYMVNCAHPDHFEPVLDAGADWTDRVRGLRANASRRSHAELNESTALDAGDAEELGGQYRRLASRLRCLNVVGGCCGTDLRHVEQMAIACAPLFSGRRP